MKNLFILNLYNVNRNLFFHQIMIFYIYYSTNVVEKIEKLYNLYKIVEKQQ